MMENPTFTERTSSSLLSDSSDEAGIQLQHDLNKYSRDLFDASSKRPILRHLNADSSWLLSLPYPDTYTGPPSRSRFNIVIDAWLIGPQIDGFSWFSSQEHANPSEVQSLSELNTFLQEAESKTCDASFSKDSENSYIDAVVCSHEFTDHCHEATLTSLPSTTPIFAPRKAASLIRSWKHFLNVTEIPVYSDGFNWRENGVNVVLSDWISIGRIYTKGDLPIHFHSALAISFQLEASGQVETIIYTPHGISAESLSILKTASPPIKVLALLHGLHDISLVGTQLNLGKENALKARKLTAAKYWLPTHDEVKIAHGIVATFLKRIAHTTPLAPGSHPLTPDKSEITVYDRTFVDIKNGQSIVLE